MVTTAKVMKLVDASTGLMKCRVCGAELFAKFERGTEGNYKIESWKCSKGCEMDLLKE